jgi:superfamily I DNA and RNA helicase
MQVGLDTKDVFRAVGAVTITSVFRAKGSEASLIYVYGFEDVSGNTDVVRKRNRAFTAMTRTRGWLVLTGIGHAKELFQEIDAILEKIGCVSFIVPDMATIQRNLETYENQRNPLCHNT